MIQGIPGHRPLNTDEPEPNGGDLAPEDAPSWFEPGARLLWAQVVRDAPPGLLRPTDGPLLVSFVGALWLREQAMVGIAKFGCIVKGDDGPAKNPFLTVLRQADAVIIRAGAELGLSPSSRSRVKIANPKKPRSAFGDLKRMDVDGA